MYEDTYEYQIVITLSEGDFIDSMGRVPKDKAEFDNWAHLAEKTLLHGHIDWSILYECTKAAMDNEAAEDETQIAES